MALGSGNASGQSIRHPRVEEDLAAVDIDAVPAPALDQPSIPSGPLGGLYMGTGRCGDRPGAPERLVRGGGPCRRHRDRRVPGHPASIAPLALVASWHFFGSGQCRPLGTHTSTVDALPARENDGTHRQEILGTILRTGVEQLGHASVFDSRAGSRNTQTFKPGRSSKPYQRTSPTCCASSSSARLSCGSRCGCWARSSRLPFAGLCE